MPTRGWRLGGSYGLQYSWRFICDDFYSEGSHIGQGCTFEAGSQVSAGFDTLNGAHGPHAFRQRPAPCGRFTMVVDSHWHCTAALYSLRTAHIPLEGFDLTSII